MVDGVILVVDAFEGPMPQTKFVLKKALELKSGRYCMYQQNRPSGGPARMKSSMKCLSCSSIWMLLTNSSTVHLFLRQQNPASAVLELSDEAKDMKPLFETIIDHIPAPEGDPDADTQVLISTIDYNEYVGPYRRRQGEQRLHPCQSGCNYCQRP